MLKSFATTLSQLNEDPAAIKASGISEERTLILDMLDELSANPEMIRGCVARHLPELLASLIREGYHRRDFGQ